MSSGNTPKKNVVPIFVALIGAAATVSVGYLQFGQQPSERIFVGRVVNTESEDTIRNAKITLESEGAPLIDYTDTEGIFTFILESTARQVRVRVDASGYDDLDRRITLSSKSGLEEIKLTPSKSEDIPDPPEDISPPGEILPIPAPNSSEKFRDLKKGILFELSSCVQEDDTLTCDVLLTDQRENREVTVYVNSRHAKSRVIDMNASQADPHHVEFGDSESRSAVAQPLVQNIPLKAALIFTETQVQGNTVSLVEIGVSTQEDNYFSAQFTNVPVTK